MEVHAAVQCEDDESLQEIGHEITVPQPLGTCVAYICNKIAVASLFLKGNININAN